MLLSFGSIKSKLHKIKLPKIETTYNKVIEVPYMYVCNSANADILSHSLFNACTSLIGGVHALKKD